jgi:prepilin-type N-terminal cleavage/methylation domain-containing protein
MVFGKSFNKRGFTLIEMAVVLVLFGVLVMFAAGMLAPILRSEITATQKRDVEKAMNRLIQRIKMSFYDVPLYANLNWDQTKDANNSVFVGLLGDNYSFTLGRAPLFYSSGYPVYDSNGKGFWLYSGIPVKRAYFNAKAINRSYYVNGSGTDNDAEYFPDWFEYSRKVCEHTEATITVKECLNKECKEPDDMVITEQVAFLITTPNLTPKVEYPVNIPCSAWPNGGPNADIYTSYDNCPGGVDNKRTIEIPYTERYDSSYKFITLGRLRDEIGCNAGQIIPRSYTPPTINTSSDLYYVTEGYVGRVALTFAVSHGWPMYWCIEWEHEVSRVYWLSGGAPQSAPTKLAEDKQFLTTNSGVGPVRGYCLRKVNNEGEVDPKYISFGDSQLLHVLLAPTGLESTGFTSLNYGESDPPERRARLNNRGVYHLNLYISDRPDMSKIVDHVTLNFVQ